MRVKFGNKIFESDKIIYPGGRGNELFVSILGRSYEVTCVTEKLAKSLFDQAFINGYVDFNRDDVDYDNSGSWKL